MGSRHSKPPREARRSGVRSGFRWRVVIAIGAVAAVVLTGGLLPFAMAPAATGGTGRVPHGFGAAGLPGGVDASASRPAADRSVGAAAGPAASFTLGYDATTPTAVELNWTTPGTIGFGNYTVEVSPNGTAGSFHTVGVVTSGTTYVATALTPGGANYWQVSVNAWIGSGSSNVIEVTQPTLAYVTSWQPSTSSVQLNWTNNATYGGGVSFVEYVVYEGVGGARPTVVTTITDVATRTYTISGLLAGSSYAAFVNTTDCLTGCGTTSSSQTTTESNVVTYGTPAPLTVSVVATRALIDTGQSDLFLCTPSGGASPFHFSWNFGNGTFAPGASSQAHTWAAAGIQNITCRVTDHSSTTATAATSVLVNPSPVLQASTNRTAADVGQSISFLCAASGGTAPVTLTWNLGDAGTLTVGNGTHTYSVPGHYTAECIAKDATSTTVGASVSLNISSALLLHASVNAGAAAPGTSLAFHVAATNGSGGYAAFRWSFEDNAGSFPGPDVTHTFHTVGNFSVVAHGKDSNGALAAALLFVNVTALAVSAHASASSVAPGTTVTFSASAHGGAGAPFNFTWHFGDGSTGYGMTATHAFSGRGSFDPVLVVADALGANNTTALPAIAVAPPPGPMAWFTVWTALLIVIVLAVLGAVAVYLWRRRAASAAFDSMQGRVPPAGPDDVVKGAKVCSNCGVSNLPIRKTCTNCGRPLRRAPFS